MMRILGAVLEREIAVLVEGSDVPGMEPAVAQGGGARLRILPVARHHHAAATEYLSAFARRHGLPLRAGDHHIDTGERPADGAEARLPARIIALRDVLLRKRGDGHRALALAIDLREAWSEAIERLDGVFDIKRRATRYDGANAVGIAISRAVEQAADHGGRSEHGRTRPAREQREDFFRLEATGFRHDVNAESCRMRHDVKAGAVAHGGCVHERIAGRDGINLGGIGMTRPIERAMSEHRSFRPPRRSRGVEQPCQIVRLAQRDRDRIGLQQALVLRGADGEKPLQRCGRMRRNGGIDIR